MSLFEGLSIANRGLAASQLALNVTGQNISNANTEGYSRKRLALSADYRTDGSYGQMGFGVDVRYIERVRNTFIDRQMVTQKSAQGYTEDMDFALERLENIHQEPSDTGLASALDNFWNSWSDVSNNPADKSSREALKSTTEVLTERFHYTANEISSYKNSINEQISDYTTQINNLASQISDLNQTIASAEGTVTDQANDSRDQRDLLLQELSTIVKISYVEDPSGAVSVTSGGNMLVSPHKALPLEAARETVHTPDGETYSNYTIRYQGSEDTFKADGGRLKALFDIRDTVIPSYEKELNVVAKSLVESVNAVHKTGYNMNRMTGVEFFDENNVNASNISLSAAILDDSNNIAAGKGGNIVGVAGAALASDATNIADLTTVNTAYRNVAVGSVVLTDTATGRVLEEGADKDYVVDYELGRIRIINDGAYPAGTNFNVDFKYNDSGFSGVGDGGNATDISLIRDKKAIDLDSAGNPTHTISEYYAGYIGRLGVERNQATSNLDTQKALVEQLSGQQESISGVNLDEEMSNMVRYQQTFQASARFLSTIKDMMDVLMNV